MSNQTDFDESASNRTVASPYTSQHPVPTVQGYEAHQEQRQAAVCDPDANTISKEPGESKLQAIVESTKSHLHLDSSSKEKKTNQEPYKSQNRNTDPVVSQSGIAGQEDQKDQDDELEGEKNKRERHKEREDERVQDTSQAVPNTLDPRQKRKNMKHMTRDTTGREVTDPVTHLPVTIHDSTNEELNKVPENTPPSGLNSRSATGFSAASKSETQLEKETEQAQAEHRGMEKLFPPPSYQATEKELAQVYNVAITFGLGSVLAITVLMLVLSHLVSVITLSGNKEPSMSWSRLLISSAIIVIIGIGIGSGLIFGVRGWLNKRVDNIWEDQVWAAARTQEQGIAESPTPESTQWLNSLLSSVWSLINPDLFTSLVDTLEDVMQASLPRLVRMISVEDLGQGSEAIRILGIRWLPTGAAAKDVSVNGKVKSGKSKVESDRKVPGEGELEDNTNLQEDHQGSQREEGSQRNEIYEDEEANDENIAEGMEAEEGDFVNLEVAFSYRASSSGKSLRVKSKNAHLYLAFYLPGGIRFRTFPNLTFSVLLLLNIGHPQFH